METEKSGKIKLTFELEINQPAMELIKEDVILMAEMAAQGLDAMRERMQLMRKQGRGMGMMMHHSQE
jgi:hypothetical protein